MSEGKNLPNYATSPRSTGPSTHCTGEHSYYMASEIEVPERGKLILVGFCTHCKDQMHLEFDILRK